MFDLRTHDERESTKFTCVERGYVDWGVIWWRIGVRNDAGKVCIESVRIRSESAMVHWISLQQHSECISRWFCRVLCGDACCRDQRMLSTTCRSRMRIRIECQYVEQGNESSKRQEQLQYNRISNNGEVDESNARELARRASTNCCLE